MWEGGGLQIRFVEEREAASHTWTSSWHHFLIWVGSNNFFSGMYGLHPGSMIHSSSQTHNPSLLPRLLRFFTLHFSPSPPTHRTSQVFAPSSHWVSLPLSPTQAHWLLTLAQRSLSHWKAETFRLHFHIRYLRLWGNGVVCEDRVSVFASTSSWETHVTFKFI